MARTRRKVPVVERFMGKIEKQADSGCWIWTAARNAHGYGVFSIERRTRPAHRVSHELFIGPIPPRFVIDHLCRVHACVNPDHLEAVTPWENVVRAPSHTIPHHQHRIAGEFAFAHLD